MPFQDGAGRHDVAVDPVSRLRSRLRLRRIGRVVGWIAAALLFVGAAVSTWSMARFPSALALDPVPAEATVTGSFINGFGGDPAVNYVYWVDGRRYTGWGTTDTRHRNLLSLAAGALVSIKYARSAPSQSCMCTPTDERGSGTGYAINGVLMLPLPILAVRALRRRKCPATA